jgi:hypothetical protein
MAGVTEPCRIRESVGAVLRKAVTHWRVYYGDGSVADSRETTWEDCPGQDVQVVLLFRPSNKLDCLYCEGLTGDDEYRLPALDFPEAPESVKFGKWTSWENYDAIFTRAMADQRVEWDLYQEKRRGH